MYTQIQNGVVLKRCHTMGGHHVMLGMWRVPQTCRRGSYRNHVKVQRRTHMCDTVTLAMLHRLLGRTPCRPRSSSSGSNTEGAMAPQVECAIKVEVEAAEETGAGDETEFSMLTLGERGRGSSPARVGWRKGLPNMLGEY